ncbi:MAG TPA: hypothetical protein VGA34_09940 [Alteraurantiacibacter sp.]
MPRARPIFPSVQSIAQKIWASEPLHIVEIQVGEYLGEDDIQRYEDNYGRPPSHNKGR